MAWVRVDDDLTEHPKVLSAGPLALIVHVRALCYASRNLTDGHIPPQIIGSFCWDLENMAHVSMPVLATNLAEALCEANLWHRNGFGYVIHDYLKYNFSREEVLKRRVIRSSVGLSGGIMSGKSRRSASKQTRSKNEPNSKQTRSKNEPPSPSPVVELLTTVPSTALLPVPGCEPSSFETFWQAYPRKVGKGAARQAWAKRHPPITVVLVALARQRESEQWQRDGGQFIPHPSTWLNQERWQDEPETPPTPDPYAKFPRVR